MLHFLRSTTSLATILAACASVAFTAAPLQAGSEPPMYNLVELSHLSSAGSVLIGISDATPSGPVVVGQSFSSFTPPTLSWRATAWRPDVSLSPVDLLSIAQAGNSSVNRAQDVSPSGTYIVGYSNAPTPRGKRWTFDPESGLVTAVETLAPLGSDGASEGVGVNNTGRVAGYSLTDSSTTRGTTWAPGSTTAVLLPGPAGSGGFRLAREISEAPSEHIVGRCDMSSTPTTRPIIWKKTGGVYGTGQILDLLFPSHVHDAVGITPNGLTAVGLGANATEARGVSWDTTTNEVTDIGGLCCSQNVVYDMNNDGVGVGYVGLAFDVFRAVLFWEGEAYHLSDRIANMPEIGDTLFLHVATGINSAGQIVGKFGEFGSGEPLSPGRVFILTPIEKTVACTGNGECGPDDYCHKSVGDCDGAGICAPRPTVCPDVVAPVCGCNGGTYGNSCEAAAAGVNVLHDGFCCDGDVDRDGNVGFGDLTLVLLNWGTCDVDPCLADVTHDGEVGFADLTYILLHWGPCGF